MCGTPHVSRMTSTLPVRPGTVISPAIFASDSRAMVFSGLGAWAVGHARADTHASAVRVTALVRRIVCDMRECYCEAGSTFLRKVLPASHLSTADRTPE